ncbi:sigma factor [Paenarthrobacter ureafaciens]
MTLAVSATAAWQSERNRLLGIAYRMLGDFGHAEDVVSEVAIDAVRQERRSGVDSLARMADHSVRAPLDRPCPSVGHVA